MTIKEYTTPTGKAIRLIHGDCMEWMQDKPKNYWDLAICDPPYGIGINVNMGRRKGDKPSNYHRFEGHDKSIPNKDYFDFLFRCSQNQIVWGGNYMTEHLPPSPCWLLWDKGFSPDVTFAQFEMAWSSFKTSAKKFDQHPTNSHRIHPTEKPVRLYRWLLTNYAKPDDRILDTHGGSMSHAIACWDEDFALDIIELDRDYYDAAVKRFEQHIKQTRLF